MTITIPHPPDAASPNGRYHYYAVAAAKRKLYDWAYLAANAACDCNPPRWRNATCKVIAYYSMRRRRDTDNITSSLKAAFDALQGAGIVWNDSGLVHLPSEIRIDRENPRIEIEVNEIKVGES